MNVFLVRPGIDYEACNISALSVLLRALLFIAALASAVLTQPGAVSASGDIANQPVSGSVEDLARGIEHQHHWRRLNCPNVCGKRGERTKLFSFSIWGNFGFVRI